MVASGRRRWRRRSHPRWGPSKFKTWLETRYPQTEWPSPSTIGLILKQKGLVADKKKRLRVPPRASEPLAEATAPNVIWCTDFKGCFRVDAKYCHPLTISDAFSRYLLCVQSMAGERTEFVRPAFESVFREYGLPMRIRSDNGAPFATKSIGGLSEFSIWWIKLGIVPERIDPGSPQQNGRHERMHRTLKAGTANPPSLTLGAQQRAFEDFLDTYNNDRPHAVLGNRVPAAVYSPSPRPYPSIVPDPEYTALKRSESRRLKMSAGSFGMGRSISAW